MDNKLSLIKERILYIANYYGISYESFSKKIGMSYANFRGQAKKTPINSDALAVLLSIYKDVNPDWLITGEGEMLRSDCKPAVENYADKEISLLEKRLQDKDETIKALKDQIELLKSHR